MDAWAGSKKSGNRLLTIEQTRKLLNVSESRLADLIEIGDVLVVEHDDAGHFIPAFQFGVNGELLPGLWAVQVVLNPDLLVEQNDEVAAWLSATPPQLGGRRRADELRATDGLAVLREAAHEAENRGWTRTSAGMKARTDRMKARTREFEKSIALEFEYYSETEVRQLLRVAWGSPLPALCNISINDEVVYPAFQVDHHTGELRPVIIDLLTLTARLGRRTRGTTRWLFITNSDLGGRRPVDLLDGEPDRVLRAAERSWQVEW